MDDSASLRLPYDVLFQVIEHFWFSPCSNSDRIQFILSSTLVSHAWRRAFLLLSFRHVYVPCSAYVDHLASIFSNTMVNEDGSALGAFRNKDLNPRSMCHTISIFIDNGIWPHSSSSRHPHSPNNYAHWDLDSPPLTPTSPSPSAYHSYNTDTSDLPSLAISLIHHTTPPNLHTLSIEYWNITLYQHAYLSPLSPPSTFGYSSVYAHHFTNANTHHHHTAHSYRSSHPNPHGHAHTHSLPTSHSYRKPRTRSTHHNRNHRHHLINLHPLTLLPPTTPPLTVEIKWTFPPSSLGLISRWIQTDPGKIDGDVPRRVMEWWRYVASVRRMCVFVERLDVLDNATGTPGTDTDPTLGLRALHGRPRTESIDFDVVEDWADAEVAERFVPIPVDFKFNLVQRLFDTRP